VKLPKDSRSAGELAVRQLYQHREVGRITWRFAPPVKKRPSKIFGKSESEKELVSANDLARVRTPLVIAE